VLVGRAMWRVLPDGSAIKPGQWAMHESAAHGNAIRFALHDDVCGIPETAPPTSSDDTRDTGARKRTRRGLGGVMADAQRKRDPFDDEAKMAVAPVEALCDRIDWLRDQQIMLSVGTQGVVSGQQKLDAHVGQLLSDMRWGRALLFLLLLERVAEHVFTTAPAKAMIAMVSP
jgi:hypothetical protein